jgi:putative ABC transport system permease protein
MLALLRTFSWQELRRHRWRSLAALLAVTAGVGLAFSVHLINASALSEFGSAARQLNGQPDLVVRAAQASFDEAVLETLGRHPAVELASPVLELGTYAMTATNRQRVAVRVLGIDPLVAATITPGLSPRLDPGENRLDLFAPDTVFLNATAFELLGLEHRAAAQPSAAPTILLQSGLELRPARVRGSVAPPSLDEAGATDEPAAPGRRQAAVVVMDIGAAQELFDKVGQLSRIDVRLRPGANAREVARQLALPAGLSATDPALAASRASQLSRAYRVNLTVLALVALFTGAFLVFSMLSLSVIQRAPQFALLAVLGLTGPQRMRLVLAEALAFGLLASALGVALGATLAALALRLLGADMGGGYFSDLSPALVWDNRAALLYFMLGLLAAVIGAWWPARLAQQLAPAPTLKGSGVVGRKALGAGPGLALMAAGALAALLPPLFELPLGAYLGVGLVLTGGVLALPAVAGLGYRLLSPWMTRRPLLMLALERAHRLRHDAASAVGAVVVSLSLAVALTVMVASFRNSVASWLDRVLPADLYLRSAASSSMAEATFLTPQTLARIGDTPGVARVLATRVRPLQLRPERPPVVLLARALTDPAQELPLVGPVLAVPDGRIGVFVSEAMVDLYQLRPGADARLLDQALPGASASLDRLFVAGVLRDYVRQFGSVVIDIGSYQRITGDLRFNDVAVWLRDDARPEQVQQALRERLDGLLPAAGSASQPQPGGLLEMASTAQLRAVSLRIFDRSFAVTYWLQAIAIGIGLFGVATSFSAQVLARRREFGLLAHVGLTRRQILGLVAAEGGCWTLIGSVAGLALGLATGFILVEVVNPQSFHWTMDLTIPWLRLLALCLAVVAAGTLTAWLAGRAAASADAVAAVKEDW